MNDDLGALEREATLHEVSELMKQSDSDLLYKVGAERILGIVRAYTAVICTGISLQPGSLALTWDLVLRCIARKAEARLSSVISLTSTGDSASALGLLRPTSEEL